MRGAGYLFITGRGRNRRMLLLRRSPRVTAPNLWAPPGGTVERGEDTKAAALREFEEEAGPLPPHRNLGKCIARRGADEYTTFVAEALPFTPTLNWENSGWAWVTRSGALAAHLYPDVRSMLHQPCFLQAWARRR